MGFIVEDGAGVTGATSYTTVEFADDYFSDRNITTWTGSETVKEGALILATDYLDKRFNFIGDKVSFDQALEWPRTGTPYGSDVIPVDLQKACVEYALRALTSALAPDPVTDVSGQRLTKKRSKVGPIEKEFEYSEGGAMRIYKNYPSADAYLKGLVINAGRRAIR